jgi:mono/diheme cytochrome c family protein
MPAFRFPSEDFQRLSAYLESLKTPPPPTADAKTTFTNLCARCHGDKGDGQGKVAWYIDPSPRDFTKPGFMASKPRPRFVASIEEGVGGTSMPPWKRILKDEQINGVLDYVMQTFAKEQFKELKTRNIPEKNPVASSADSIARGEQIFELRCIGCHGRKADGKGPNSLDIFPHPRNFRNHFFVESVPDRRLFESIEYGVQGTAMPSWIDMLSTNEVGDVINFIRSFQSGRK